MRDLWYLPMDPIAAQRSMEPLHGLLKDATSHVGDR